MKNFLTFLQCLFGLSIVITYGQPASFDKWEFATNDHSIVEYQGKQALRIKQNRAMLKGVNFQDGVIEYDMAFPQGRSFIGFNFRMQDELNSEDFYIRTHQSGNPDANQYTPVYHGEAAWQLYYGEGYAAPAQYKYNTWTHFKLVVSGKYLEVYIDDMNNPVLLAEMKRTPVKGDIGIYNANTESYFANITVTPGNPTIKSTPKEKEKISENTVQTWAISEPFSEKELETLTSLKGFPEKKIASRAPAENTGTVNIASQVKFTKETNTVIAQITIDSDKDQVKKFTFGFSDRARVFLNGDLLFFGSDGFLSRDYRFLGTIGYYDAVYLHLKKGPNTLSIAISEDFGGWGIRGRFDDLNGIKLVP